MVHEIRTARLRLRPLQLSDLESVHEYAHDSENTLYMYHLPREREETAAFLSDVTKEWEKDEPGFYEFAVELDGALIGAVSVYLNDRRDSGYLGWILNRKYWRNGYATEAAAALRDFALHTLRLRKLIATCDARNAASSRVMEKIGLTLESDQGVRVYPKKNETARELTYSLIR